MLGFWVHFPDKKVLLGCCGPAGLHVLPGKPPSMRVMPRFFWLSSSQDAPAQQLLPNLFVTRSQELEVEVTDLFRDLERVMFL